ncbi:MAG: hypothetical protein LBC64_07490 [Fibromonadaceae bacterium]|jgi:hypothetical protein|nr:hypothetical protein [Fibromonadaceae bacterium]
MNIKIKVDLEFLRKHIPSNEFSTLLKNYFIDDEEYSQYINLEFLKKYIPVEELCTILENCVTIVRGGFENKLIPVKIDLDILKKYIPAKELCPILESCLIYRAKRAKAQKDFRQKKEVRRGKQCY